VEEARVDVWQSIVKGIVQGLTEFIPVSSTAHLILAPQVFPIAPPRAEIAHTYDTVIQVGTVIPVLFYFWREWLRLLQAGGLIVRRFRVSDDQDERMVTYLVVGSIPAGVLGLLLERRVARMADPANVDAFLYIGLALIGVGILMWLVELSSRKARTIENLTMADAVMIGLAQAAALFPGVSRSGATITAGLFIGLTREAAARYSFLLMTPILLAATAYKGYTALRGEHPPTPAEWQSILLATVVSAITGYLAIAFLLGWLRTRSLGLFALWRIVAGTFSLGLYWNFSRQPEAAPLTSLLSLVGWS
jgi:undecaprenyl-diphosphatase